jgi:hypothetical protein
MNKYIADALARDYARRATNPNKKVDELVDKRVLEAEQKK